MRCVLRRNPRTVSVMPRRIASSSSQLAGTFTNTAPGSVANPIHDDRRVDPMRELADVLSVVGLDPHSGGGEVVFIGRDPVVKSV
jgi:hypothetical protein